MSLAVGEVNAPEFPAGLDWLNTEHPLQLRDLRGKIVLLDFWTYCCINCMHVLPDLKRLEQKYARELVVIGVHSAKFHEERGTENIRQAILRYEIDHPVVNDEQMVLWRLYAIRAWPTLVLIDPEGKVVGQLAGEGNYDVFDEAIKQLVDEFDVRRLLDRSPLAQPREREQAAESLLSFPGKAVADEGGEHLFIADTNHHRLLVVSLPEGYITAVIGSGEPGLMDGNYTTARFRHPQGLAVVGKRVYVADTGNHAIRQVDLEKRTVATLAGTGEQAHPEDEPRRGEPTRLNSPWDVVARGDALYIAMAGSHQIWRLDLHTHAVAAYAGTGREARQDGPLASAAFAQPSGLATDGQRLYVADSEASAVRAVDLDPEGRVVTLAGGDLFDFGDHDGEGLSARFQHPIGLAYAGGALYLADTYNHKIKRLALDTRVVETVLGTGEPGAADDPPQLREPTGLSVSGTTLYVADTNNHVIRAVDLATGAVTTRHFQEAPPEAPPVMPEFFGQVIPLPAQSSGVGPVVLTASLSLPPGHALTKEAPVELRVRVTGDIVAEGAPAEQQYVRPEFPVQAPLQLQPGKGTVEVEYDIYYCQEGDASVCLYKEARLLLPVRAKMTFPGHALRVSFDIEKD